MENVKETSVTTTPAKKVVSSKKLAKREAKKSAFEALKNAVVKSGNAEAIAALKIVKPGLFGIKAVGGDGPARFKVFTDKFVKVGDTMDEVKLFQEMKAGRKEANGFIRVSLKKSAEGARKWISFNPETGIYKLEAVGKNPPANWTGYVPTKAEDIFAEK